MHTELQYAEQDIKVPVSYAQLPLRSSKVTGVNSYTLFQPLAMSFQVVRQVQLLLLKWYNTTWIVLQLTVFT